MNDGNIRQVLAVQKPLVVGITNNVTSGMVYLDRGANILPERLPCPAASQ